MICVLESIRLRMRGLTWKKLRVAIAIWAIQRDALSCSVSQHLADRNLPVPPGLTIVAHTSMYQDVYVCAPLMQTLGVLHCGASGGLDGPASRGRSERAVFGYVCARQLWRTGPLMY